MLLRQITRIFALRAKIPTACRLRASSTRSARGKPNLIPRRFARGVSFEATSAAAKQKSHPTGWLFYNLQITFSFRKILFCRIWGILQLVFHSNGKRSKTDTIWA